MLMNAGFQQSWKMSAELIDFISAGWHHSPTSLVVHPPALTIKFKEISSFMNKAELVEAVQKTLGKEASKAQAERAVEAVVEGIKGGLKKGKPVQLVGFGTFKVASRKARMGINPKTGEKIKIKASKSVKFAAGKDLKSKLK
jgi:DNA-binding protein HU-beta